jgi:hypothetical protein
MLGAQGFHWCQLNVDWAVKTATTQTRACVGRFQNPSFSLVRAGGLGFYSRDFQSLGLKLTLMKALDPYKWRFNGRFA